MSVEFVMDYLDYFRDLLTELKPKYDIETINDFINQNYSEILELQYKYDKESGILSSHLEFIKHYFDKQEYVKNENGKKELKIDYLIDERTYRRWRKNKLKNGLPKKYYPIFRSMKATEILFNEKYLKNFASAVQNQDKMIFLGTCYGLKNSKMLHIVSDVLERMKSKENLPMDSYLNELRDVFEQTLEEFEYKNSSDFEFIPEHNFNRKTSTVKIFKNRIPKNQLNNYVIKKEHYFNKISEELKSNHYKAVLHNEEAQ